MIKGAMPSRVRWLAVVGTIGLAIGLYMAVMDEPRLRTNLVLLAGAIPWVLFFLINEPWEDEATPRPDDEPLPR
jgi:hypothetical protein